MCKKILLALVAGWMISGNAQAQCLGGCCSAANVVESTRSLNYPQKGEWIIGSSLLTMQYQPLTDEELLNNATASFPVFSVASQWSVKGSIAYGITRRWYVAATLPYNHSSGNKEGHFHEVGHTEIHDYGQIRGLGDGTLTATYQFIDKKEKGWKAFVGGGIKIPTGKTNAYSTYAVVLPVHLQPGTGSWDPLLNASLQKTINKFILSADVNFKWATSAKGHNMGNYGRAGLAANYELMPSNTKSLLQSLKCSAGVYTDYNASMKITATEDGQHDHDTTLSEGETMIDPNTGFRRLFATAGASMMVGPHVYIPVSFSVPIVQHLNGYQAKNQLTASIGISIIFNSKKTADENFKNEYSFSCIVSVYFFFL
jgi:hypothetical protein